MYIARAYTGILLYCTLPFIGSIKRRLSVASLLFMETVTMSRLYRLAGCKVSPCTSVPGLLNSPAELIGILIQPGGIIIIFCVCEKIVVVGVGGDERRRVLNK